MDIGGDIPKHVAIADIHGFHGAFSLVGRLDWRICYRRAGSHEGGFVAISIWLVDADIAIAEWS
jgi:hypothetical protein